MRRLNKKWIKRLLDKADHIAGWSKDPSTKVGAVIIDQEGGILTEGYNGFPRRTKDLPERYNNRELKYLWTVHAETNAIAQAARKGGAPLENAILVVPFLPCAPCAGIVVNAGIRVVIARKLRKFSGLNKRWEQSQNVAVQMFKEAGVKVIYGEGKV